MFKHAIYPAYADIKLIFWHMGQDNERRPGERIDKKMNNNKYGLA